MSKYPSKVHFIFLIIIGTILFLSGAALFAEEGLEALKEQARSYRDQGWQEQQRGKIEEALTYYQKAVIADPMYVVAYNDLGIIYEAMGYSEEAKEMYLKALEVAPDYPDTYSNLALFYEDKNDYANAVLYWVKRAILGGPQDPWAEAARRRLEEIAKTSPEAYSRIGNPQQERVSLFAEDKTSGVSKVDNKIQARDYLSRAKDSFSRGDYVTALKDATLAEYLDSSNQEISVFVEKVRKALLR